MSSERKKTPPTIADLILGCGVSIDTYIELNLMITRQLQILPRAEAINLGKDLGTIITHNTRLH